MHMHHHLPYNTGHCSALRTGLYASSPEPHGCHGNGNGKGNGKKYGMMSSSSIMRPEEAGADTASPLLQTHPMPPHPSHKSTAWWGAQPWCIPHRSWCILHRSAICFYNRVVYTSEAACQQLPRANTLVTGELFIYASICEADWTVIYGAG